MGRPRPAHVERLAADYPITWRDVAARVGGAETIGQVVFGFEDYFEKIDYELKNKTEWIVHGMAIHVARTARCGRTGRTVRQSRSL